MPPSLGYFHLSIKLLLMTKAKQKGLSISLDLNKV